MSTPDDRGAASRFLRDEGGAYAIEFAFFGSLMIAVMLILIQYAVVHLARQNLNDSLQIATRALLTGSFQSSNGPGLTQAQTLDNMRALMCGGKNSPAVFFKCENLKIEIRVRPAFATSAPRTPPVDPSSGGWSKDFGKTSQCPGSQSIAEVIAAVKLPLIAPLFITIGMKSFGDGAVALQAASVFRVEPFDKSATGAC